MFRVSLRLWCILQVSYERQLHLHDPASAAALEPHWREMYERTVRGGHLDPDFFGTLDMHDERLREPLRCTDEAILDAAKRRVMEYLRIGLAESQHLAGYVGAVSRHLWDCAACRRAVCDATRTEMQTSAMVRHLARSSRAEGVLTEASRRRILHGLKKAIAKSKMN